MDISLTNLMRQPCQTKDRFFFILTFGSVRSLTWNILTWLRKLSVSTQQPDFKPHGRSRCWQGMESSHTLPRLTLRIRSPGKLSYALRTGDFRPRQAIITDLRIDYIESKFIKPGGRAKPHSSGL